MEPLIPDDLDVLALDLKSSVRVSGGYVAFVRRHSRISAKVPVILATSDALVGALREELDFSAAIGRNVFVCGEQECDIRHTFAEVYQWRQRALAYTGPSTGQPGELPLPNEDAVELVVRHRDLLFDLLMNFLPDNIYFKDRQSRFLLANRAMAEKFQVPDPESMLGLTDQDLFGEMHATEARLDEQDILQGKVEIVRKLEQEDWPDGRVTWAQTTKMPIRTQEGLIIGTFGVSRDITNEREMELRLQRERNLSRTLLNLLPARVFVKDTRLAYTFNNLEHLRYLGLDSESDALGRKLRDFIDNAWSRRLEVTDRMIIEEGRCFRNVEEYDEALNKWMLVNKVPLRDPEGTIIGLVGLSIDVTHQKRLEQTLKARNREMETELALARALQQTFLPQSYPTLLSGPSDAAPKVRFAHFYQPSFTLGGDFLSVLGINDHVASVLLCDVMGHGVRASLVTAMLRALSAELRGKAEDPAAFLAALNHLLHESLDSGTDLIFVTAFYGVIDTQLGTVRYCNAGSSCAIILRPDGAAQKLDCEGQCDPALGIFDEFAFRVFTAPIGAGDEMICYTDGVIEASHQEGEEFGEVRLMDYLRQQHGETGRARLEKLVRFIKDYCGTDSFDDDICLFSAHFPPS